MSELPPALPHGQLAEVFPDVFFVTGMMKTMLMDVPWQFSRNMIVVRSGEALTLINSIRLNDTGLRQLETLGRVANVVKIGSLHGRDDAFYRQRYGATFWALAGMTHEDGLGAGHVLQPDGEMPFKGCGVFVFRTIKQPECILSINHSGGILVSCDSLQNWLEPDEFFSDETRRLMTEMSFFQPANIGPLWLQINEPHREDFARLLNLSFRHALCGHGVPLRDFAKEAYAARIQNLFGPYRP